MPKAMREWINSQIETGEYANASDFIRDLIVHDQPQCGRLSLALSERQKSEISKRSVTDISRSKKRRRQRG